MKKTKIICTIGPACDDKDSLISLMKAGMNVARINMSHGTHESHQKTIDNIKAARSELGTPLALMLDTKGPEIRLGEFPKRGIELAAGDIFTLTKKQIMGTKKIASVSYQQLIDDVCIGDKIYANNGMLVLKVVAKKNDSIDTKVLFGGKLTTHKGINVPGVKIRSKFLSEADKSDLLFAIKNYADYIAASFVSNKEDLFEMKDFLKNNGAKDIKIIAKIENGEGVKKIDEIIENSDGIMVARGDLGVEIPLEKIPHIQKKIIKACNNEGKISIVATEMLESMTNSLRPTRAEVSDVANAIYERATATMLSGETAVGINPLRVVKTMAKIISETEKNISYNNKFLRSEYKTLSISDSVASSTCKNLVSLGSPACCVYTETGSTAELISRYRIKNRIIALTSNQKTFNQLALCWNTTAILTKMLENEYEMIENAKYICKTLHLGKTNDIIVMVVGTPKQTGKTNTIKILNL
ncbi:MAG: pyruvate kinase [Christensenellales bacterium]